MKRAIYLKELEYFTPEVLKSKLELTDEEFSTLISEARTENLIKEQNGSLSFNYVGIILTSFCSLMVYPKYLSSPDPSNEFRQIIKVIEKDSGANLTNFFDMDSESQETTTGTLPVILWLIRDYYEHGLYSVNLATSEKNGNGEILWDKTIEQDDVLIAKDRPYYLTLYTSKKISDTSNIIRLIHKKIISECFSLLKESSLDVIFDISTAQIFDDSSSIDESYALIKLRAALSIEFNSHNRRLLSNLIYYLQKKISDADYSKLNLFGTTAFNMVWQRVLESVLSNIINNQLDSLQLPQTLNSQYDSSISLLQLIDYPIWHLNHSDYSTKSTLIPDIISIDKNCFYIFDAKYYKPVINQKTHQITSQPGIESVTKQYLYEQAYRQFMKLQGFRYIVNAFIIPTDQKETSNEGLVTLSFMQPFNLTDIQVIMASATQMYNAFLNDQTIKLADIPVHKAKLVD